MEKLPKCGYGGVRSREVRKEAREGRRCAEVRANWRSVAALNQQEKRKKMGAIEGARLNWREPGRIFKVIFQGLSFGQIFSRHVMGAL